MVEVEHSVDAAATRSGFMGRARDLAVSPTQVIAIAVLLVVAFVAVPAFLDSYWLLVMTGVVIYSIITLGLGVLIGRVGMVSLCQFVLVASARGWRCGSATRRHSPSPSSSSSPGSSPRSSACSSACRRCGCPASTWPSSR